VLLRVIGCCLDGGGDDAVVSGKKRERRRESLRFENDRRVRRAKAEVWLLRVTWGRVGWKGGDWLEAGSD
jgi:hypothetical protein